MTFIDVWIGYAILRFDCVFGGLSCGRCAPGSFPKWTARGTYPCGPRRSAYRSGRAGKCVEPTDGRWLLSS